METDAGMIDIKVENTEDSYGQTFKHEDSLDEDDCQPLIRNTGDSACSVKRESPDADMFVKTEVDFDAEEEDEGGLHPESVEIFNIAQPKDIERAMVFLHALPDDEFDSEQEGDADALEGLGFEELSETSSSFSSENIRHSTQIADNFHQDDISPPQPEIDSDSELSESEYPPWGKKISSFKKIETNFDENASVKFETRHEDKELDFFQQLLPDSFLSTIVEQTNLYAKQKKTKKWSDVSLAELKAFFGIHIIMGIHQLPSIDDYWSSDPYLGIEPVKKVMPLNRFKLISGHLHLNNNENLDTKDPKRDKLFKVRPFIDHLNEANKKVYKHSSYFSVDESVIAFKGRSSLRQCMTMTPTKRGYKVWCLADAKTGYIYDFFIYTGAELDKKKTWELGEKVVLRLTRSLKNKKCLVAFNDFFSSVKLAKKLKKMQIYSVGYVRADSAGLPKMMNENEEMNRGEFKFLTQSGVAAIKWRDNRDVRLLTTLYSPAEVIFVVRKDKKGKKQAVSCPLAVERYHALIGGVENFNRMRERYAIGRRSGKWWHRIFYFLLDMVIINSMILMKVGLSPSVKSTEQKTFRLNLAKQLIASFSSRKGASVMFVGKKRAVPEEIRLEGVGAHMPRKGTYRRCRLCSTKESEKRSRYTCSSCQVPLCIDVCFTSFHGK